MYCVHDRMSLFFSTYFIGCARFHCLRANATTAKVPQWISFYFIIAYIYIPMFFYVIESINRSSNWMNTLVQNLANFMNLTEERHLFCAEWINRRYFDLMIVVSVNLLGTIAAIDINKRICFWFYMTWQVKYRAWHV